MRFTLPAFGLLLALPFSLVAQEIQVRLGDVKDSRTTGQFFAGLEVEAKLTGDALDDAKSMRVKLQTARDETGRDLLKGESREEDFDELGSFGNRNTVTIKLKNPARKAAQISEITGTLDFFLPKLDPESTVTLEGFLQKAGEPLEAPALTAAKVKLSALTKPQWEERKKKMEAEQKKAKEGEDVGKALQDAFGSLFSFDSMEADGIALLMEDPAQKIVAIEFQDAAGKKLERRSRSSSKRGEVETQIYSLRGKLPAEAKLVIYLHTAKAILSVPLAMKEIALP